MGRKAVQLTPLPAPSYTFQARELNNNLKQPMHGLNESSRFRTEFSTLQYVPFKSNFSPSSACISSTGLAAPIPSNQNGSHENHCMCNHRHREDLVAGRKMSGPPPPVKATTTPTSTTPKPRPSRPSGP